MAVDVPDNIQNVDIRIQLWDWNYDEDILCDISPFDNELPDTYEVNLIYNIKTGNWYGDDYCYYDPTFRDLSGYGRLNGCDDGSIYQFDHDCEILFDIYQNDFDDDGLPYWSEFKYYGTDPLIGNFGDPDSDGIPIYWEHKWGHFFGGHSSDYWIYNPFIWDDHENLDPDNDGIFESLIENVPVGSYSINIKAVGSDNFDFKPYNVIVNAIEEPVEPEPNFTWLIYTLLGGIIGLVVVFGSYQGYFKYPPMIRKIRKLKKKIKKEKSTKPIIVKKRELILKNKLKNQKEEIELKTFEIEKFKTSQISKKKERKEEKNENME